MFCFLDLLQISWSLYGLVLFYSMENSKSWSVCFDGIPTMTYMIAICSYIGLLSIFRMTIVIVFFMMAKCIHARNERTRQRGQVVRIRFPRITFSKYLDQLALSNSISESFASESVCPICCDQFQNSDEIVILSCNIKHIFHPDCVKSWLDKNDTCPLCKERVISLDQEYLEN